MLGRSAKLSPPDHEMIKTGPASPCGCADRTKDDPARSVRDRGVSVVSWSAPGGPDITRISNVDRPVHVAARSRITLKDFFPRGAHTLRVCVVGWKHLEYDHRTLLYAL